jgi:hypothetical protein
MTRPTAIARSISDIEMKYVTFGDRSGQVIPLFYKGKNLVFQTPYLHVLSTMEKTSYKNVSEMTTLFSGDSTNKLEQWFKFIDDMEKQIVDNIKKNGHKWFSGGNVTLKSLAKTLNGDQKSFYTRWPVDTTKNIAVGPDRRPFNTNTMRQGDYVKMIVECPNYWIRGNEIGITVVVKKIMVRPTPSDDEYDFDDNQTEGLPIDSKNDNIINILSQATERPPSSSYTRPSNIPNYASQNMSSDDEFSDNSDDKLSNLDALELDFN